jgi:tRNA A37 threonylcarbamoyladenosine biosynthesis protein TsaE
MELIVNQTLRAQGFEQLRASPAGDAPYNPAYINSDTDLEALAGGIRSAKSARLCLLGPPGAGKTACARWIARQLDMQIHAKSASDLLSRYLGGTEKLMARAFREAQEAGAVLLVDEVDSFLQERSKARVSWEITQVNEFLTQMEQFQGVFIASTNQMDGLDAAALRRFDLKARFGYLRPEQSRGLLAAHLAAAGVAPADPPAIALLDSIQVLTPGDFAAVARQHRFRPLAAADAWVSALEAECSLKPAFNRRILGFGTNTAP